MSPQCHRDMQRFREEKHWQMISQGGNAFCVMSGKQIKAQFRLCQVKTIFKTASESHYLNMDFRGFKQL